MGFDKTIRFLVFTFIACLLSSDFSGGLSFHVLTAPATTVFLLGFWTCILPDIPRNIIQILLGEIIILLCIIDSYCQVFFGSAMNPQLFSVIINTDMREVGEFFSTFVGFNVLFKWRILVLILLAIIFPLSYIKSFDIFNKLKFNNLANIFLIVFIVICIITEVKPFCRYVKLFGCGTDIQDTEGLLFRRYHDEMSTPIHRVIFAYHSTKQSKKALEEIKESTFSAKIDSCSYTSPHIVLIIGESYNKHHSSLYGYKLNTTPLQQKRFENGELMVFSDVVTPWNITSNALLDIFSLWEYGSKSKLTHYPLFPVLFRQAGYSVRFYSNQMVLKGFSKGVTSQAGNYFLADRRFSDALFDYRNRHKALFDMSIVRQVAYHQKDSLQPDCVLDIVHLMGQHFDYEKRYPEDLQAFSEVDYHDRNISDEAKKVVMHYDNATFYNDVVLDSLLSVFEKDDAVVIFVSDHGEEVFDDIQMNGRLYQEPTYQQAHQEFEVPMWIWCSDSYRANHHDVEEAVKMSVNKPFMTDGIPQILLYLAGISSEYNNDSHNLLSPDYLCKKRIIGGSVDYDELRKK